MKSKMFFLLAMTCVVSLGCGQPANMPALARLEKETPVIHEKVKVLDCRLDDEPLEDGSPIQAGSQEPLELSGTLSPSEWSLKAVMNDWKDEEGRSAPRGLDLNSKPLQLILHIYGDDASTNFGLVHSCPLEARPKADNPDQIEFRVRFNAPKDHGQFVADIQAVDGSVPSLQRGVKPTKVAGIPIWRRELRVQ